MACSFLLDTGSYSWSMCNNKHDFVVKSFVNHTIIYNYCCHYHLSHTIDSMLMYENNNKSLINTYILIKDVHNNKKTILHFGNVTFGPETESDYNKKNYEDFCLEMDRIGSIYLPDNMYQQLYQEDEPDLMCYESSTEDN